MSDNFRRTGDWADVPRPLAWVLISIREVGIMAVVVSALLYICFVQINHVKDAYDSTAERVITAVNRNTEAITALRHFMTHKYDD